DLSAYSLALYNGSNPALGVLYPVNTVRALSGVIPNQQNGFGAISFAYAPDGIQNGTSDGIALVRGATVIQFLSYEGVVTASNGPAMGLTSTDIGVSETGTGAVGLSLRLTGTGNGYSDFTWAANNPAAPHTQNAINQDQFFVAIGDQAPSVTGTSPAAGASNVAVNSTIGINFSESVNASATAFSLSCGGAPQAFAQTASPANAFTLTPAANLPFSANCVVTVNASEIADADANDPPDQMAANVTFSFNTATPVDEAPAVVATLPIDGATEVDPSAGIVINFSEPVTATVSAFAIQCGAAVAFGQTSGASASFTLDPNVDLPPGTVCTVTVSGGQISDADTNDPPDRAADHSFSFTTSVPPPAHVVINEVDADTPGNGFDLAEFVELYDGGVGNTQLDGLTVVFYNGSSDTSYAAFDLDGYSTNASGYLVLGNPGVAGVDITFAPGDFGFLQNGADAVALVAGNASSFPNGTGIAAAHVIDAVVYDTDDADDPGLLALLNGGQPQVNENASGDGPNQSSGRCENGTGGLRNTSTYRAGAPSPDAANNCPGPSNSPIVISQFYGSGGNANAIYQHDYVELHNRGNVTINVTGWSLQYASAAGTSWEFGKTPLGGPIGPGEYYLVKLATNDATVGGALPAPNVTGTINMSGTSGKIALVNSFNSLLGDCPLSNPHVMDLVGYGSASCGEGNSKAPALSAATADFRINGGATDTDRNFDDFVSGAPTPRRTAEIVELGPFLVGSDPSFNGINVPRDPTLVLTFTEPVNVVGNFFDLNCAASGAHDSYSLAGSGPFVDITLNNNLVPGEACTITLYKDQVHDQDADDAAPGTDTLPGNYTWSFTVASGTPPPYAPDVHLAFGNPTDAVADLSAPQNYLMSKPEFALSYNRDLGRANWVSWHLSPEWYGSLSRVDTFRADPAIPDDPAWYRVQGFDFSGSGFDRGHMVPNADRDKETSVPINQATYLMTNMLAQAPGNNQGPWADLEAYLRTVSDAGNELYIVAGPDGVGGTGSQGGVTNTIANGHVTVPGSTWKVALVLPRAAGDDVARVSCATRTIAVIMPNVDNIREIDWQMYLTSVDAVESLTGYDFFENLPDAVEYCVEAGINGNNPPADANPPVVQCGAADGAWHADNVTLACTAADAESGLSTAADASFTLATLVPDGTENAAASTDSRVVCDAVGNCVTAGPIAGNMIDRKAPVISITAPVSGEYRIGQAVLASYACADGASGTSTCAGTVANGSPLDTSALGAQTFVVTATDAVGNASTATVTYTVVAKFSATISITNIPAAASRGGSFTPAFDYAGNGQVHLRSQTPDVCRVHGDTSVRFVGAGTCTVSAWATPSGIYERADGPPQSFVITP
ncbi:MAG TPA: DNA/RNA non-specific endonuclease, partial [Vicinamibacterales bacterium]